MAEIINCDWQGDDANTDKCSVPGGLIELYFAKSSDLDMTAMSAATVFNNGTETFLLPPVMATGATLKKLNIDEGTVSVKSVGNVAKKTWTDSVEFDSEGITPTKMYNYRRVLGCCGLVIFGVMSNGQVVAVGLQPSLSGQIELAKDPLKNIKVEIDLGKGDDDDVKQTASLGYESTSSHGMLFFNTGVTASQLESLT